MANDPELYLRRGVDPVIQLVDHVIMLMLETQQAFANTYSDYAWHADLSDPGVFVFERDPVALFRPHLVGTTSGQSQTWLWAWENINDYPDDVVTVARMARTVGEHFGSADLTTAHQPLGGEARAAAKLGNYAHPERAYSYAAAAVSGLTTPVFYRAPIGDGSYAWFVLDNEREFSLPAPTVWTTGRAITGALSSGYLMDHRLGVRAYAERRAGLALDDSSEAWTLHTSDGDLSVLFDDQSRISHVQSTMGHPGGSPV